MDARKYDPNITHKYLTKLEKSGKLKAIITQNIDGLHQKAGSKKVYELHGSIYNNKCLRCGKKYDADYIFESKEEPLCECGGLIKPEVVLYEEGLDEIVVKEAINHISKADLLIIGGTSLTVYPACNFINYYNGKNEVLINKDNTKMDNYATLVINEKLGDVFKKL